MSELREERYRCADCGHGRNLTACAYAVVTGPLAPNGTELLIHDSVDETDLALDSIQCVEHAGGAVQERVEGRWCEWRTCGNCDGRGTVIARYADVTCPTCGGAKEVPVPIEGLARPDLSFLATPPTEPIQKAGS